MNAETMAKSGSYEIKIDGGKAVIRRFFRFDDGTEVSFAAVVSEPGEMGVRALHVASLEKVIGPLQEMLEKARQP